MIEYLDNLAGVEKEKTDQTLIRELNYAGIPHVKEEQLREVTTSIKGKLKLKNGMEVNFSRAWVYWVAVTSKPIPMQDAKVINEKKGDFGGSKYSGSMGALGDVVRVDGGAGGGDVTRPVSGYHIDSPDGLKGFRDALVERYGLDDSIEYKCSACGAENVRLWRQYQTFADHIELKCVSCAEKDQDRKLDLAQSDAIGWLVPAVPTPERDTFWGYTSVPQDGVDWWKSLPLRRKNV